VFGSLALAAIETAKRPFQLRTLIILALLLFQALCILPTTDVVYAVIPSWDDPDTDDGDSINAVDMDKACGDTTLHSPSPH